MKNPQSLKEAIEILDEVFYTSEKDEQTYIKQMESVRNMIVYHHTLGRKIRNNWGFWQPELTPLKSEMLNLGCGIHADDMSMFILNIFYYHIKNSNDSIEK